MTRVEFIRVEPSCLAFIPEKAIEYLEKAANQPTADLTVLDAIAYAKVGAGDIYLGIQGENLFAAAFFMYGRSKNGKILDVALLGGCDYIKYRKESWGFLINLAKSKDCDKIVIMGRKSWGKIFPEMKEIGVVFGLSID